MLADDRDRERAAGRLQEHFVRGRLTLDELSDRVERVLTARSREELRGAFFDLPHAWRGRSAAQAVIRGAVLMLCTGVYLMFCFALLLVLALTLLIDGGASTTTLIGFLVVWLVPTYLVVRLWHRKRSW